MGRVLAGGPAVRNHELIIERPDGSRIVAMVNVDPITDAAGRVVGAVNVFQDITERKIVESELQRAKAAAEDASRAKDQFLAVLSHELRTPLTPVLLSVASMETEPGLPRQVRDDLAMIRRNISLETQLIDDLLDLSRVVNGKMPLHRQHIDVHSLIRNVVEMVAGNAEPHCITLAIKLQAAHDRVHADSARLHQVLWNLLKNAIKFTPAGGSVTIRTANPEPGRLTIEVSDTGIGIEPDALGRIFDAFDQGARAGDRRFGGLGLGLAISKAVVEMHDGTIRAHSDGKGRGSCFCVDLPVATTHELRASDGCEPAVGAGDALPLRILLVEDHADSLRLLRRLLEKFGHLVTTASSVAEATAAADAYPFDLLVSDIGLPDGTGLDVVRQVRARQPNVFAIALTGYGMEQDVRSAEAAGFAAHMTKPVDLAALRAMIRNVSRAPAPVA